MARDRKTLGDILLEQGLIDKEALSHALRLQQRRLGEILIEENLVTPVEIAAALKLQARSVVPGSNLRVSLETTKLDRLLLDLEDFEKELLRGGNRELLAASLGSARKKMEDLLFDSTVTFGARARKAVERTAEILQKSVDFHYRAVEVLVDRAFLEELWDVTLHLIRNAIDHGIEPGDLRRQDGKSPSGMIRIEIGLDATTLIMTVSDDGAGLDDEKILAKAVQMGLLKKQNDSPSEGDVRRCLFTPGFSTKDEASAVSGRGVGLDVVEATTIRLGGHVRIESKKGKGCSFSVSVPLRLARLNVLPLRTGCHWICCPADSIIDVSIESERLHEPVSPEAVRARNEVCSGAELFSRDGNGSKCREPFLLKTKNGKVWSFDEVAAAEPALMRSDVMQSVPPGIVGSVHGSRGTLLLVDLDRLDRFRRFD